MISWEEVTSVSSLPAEQEALCLGSCLHPPLGTDLPPPRHHKGLCHAQGGHNPDLLSQPVHP